MDESEQLLTSVTEEKYKYGFTTNIEQDTIAKGLNEDVVRLISAKNDEPEFMLEF
nr:Fe-S cluster assembly protein SufB [Bacteroidota bacterium]